jgi:hypothetical protein
MVMVYRSRTYWRRPRGASESGPLPSFGKQGHQPAPDTSKRGRERLQQFGRRLEATSQTLGFTERDQERVNETRHLIEPHIAEFADEIQRRTPSNLPTPIDANMARNLQVLRTDALAAWIALVVRSMPNRETGVRAASLARDQIRPAGGSALSAKGGALLMYAALLQALCAAVLGESLLDPTQLTEATSAWCKLIMVHLDALLSVHSSMAAIPRWY